MTDATTGTFRPLDQPDRRLPGKTAVLVSGHAPEEQSRLLEALSRAGLPALPVVFVTDKSATLTLQDLAACPHATGLHETAPLPRAIVLSGLQESQLHTVMAAYKACRLPPALWATATDTTASWTLRALLDELQKERQALADALRRPQG
ncbi:MAG: DUF3783 domain-containing protein [Lentisphaerae bacterium]|nr:DUF3783 domain-containing protein [Lentisphaerota bacterium]